MGWIEQRSAIIPSRKMDKHTSELLVIDEQLHNNSESGKIGGTYIRNLVMDIVEVVEGYSLSIIIHDVDRPMV